MYKELIENHLKEINCKIEFDNMIEAYSIFRYNEPSFIRHFIKITGHEYVEIGINPLDKDLDFLTKLLDIFLFSFKVTILDFNKIKIDDADFIKVIKIVYYSLKSKDIDTFKGIKVLSQNDKI